MNAAANPSTSRTCELIWRRENSAVKIFIAAFGTETNSFSPIPTGEQSFREALFHKGDATRHPPAHFSEPLHAWRGAAERNGAQVFEGLCTFAQPGGPTTRGVYESLRDELLENLERVIPVDVVLLNLHGSMVAEGCDDCEGDLLARVRSAVGADVSVGAELDLHCSITPAMLEAADVLITYKEYPHIDAKERAVELYALCVAKAEARIRPVMAVFDCRMISSWRTAVEPMTTFVRRMGELEGRDGILSVSFAHGFPWADVPEGTAKVLVVSDGNATQAEALAKKLGHEVWDMREKTAPDFTPPAEALEAALRSRSRPRTGPLVVADVSDNPGGGAPSDSTFLLRAVLDRELANVASGIYWDPTSVRFCMEAGEGATLDLRIGGKCGPASGDPVDLRVVVKAIRPKLLQSFGTSRNLMGDVVWVQARNEIDLVLNTLRTQTFHPDAFTQLGIDLLKKKLILVKSSQHFRAGFASLAGEIVYCAAPGAIMPDFANIPYRKMTRPYWPRVEDPFTS